MKVYQITVERHPAEEKMDKEVFIPSVDNMKLPGGRSPGLLFCPAPCFCLHTISFLCVTLLVEDPDESMSGFALFLIIFFSLIGVVFAGIILLIVYNKWQERSRKHFY